MSEKTASNAKLVEEFVGKAHGDMNRVQELLAQEPGLVNAAWDWGGGDWETALGAAAHMGRRDIAEVLLARGARIDLFAAAMLALDGAPLIGIALLHGSEVRLQVAEGGLVTIEPS